MASQPLSFNSAKLSTRSSPRWVDGHLNRLPPRQVRDPHAPILRPKQPDPTWEPDLILLDAEPIRTRPPGSPDPNWEPDLILLDDELPPDRFPDSPEPNWEPDLILLDDEPRDGRFPEPRDPGIARRNYIGWLTRVSARSRHEDPISQETWFNLIGVMVLLAVIVFSIWICWAVWRDGPPTEAVDATTRQQGLRP